jgi:hypothetical protein
MPSLFISYRRSDSPDTVKLLHERLKRRLPRWDTFYDHESIPLGEQFPERLRTQVAAATVVLVVIGPKWLPILQERKNTPVDHVRAEVRLALQAAANVVPVLVGHAPLPTPADLAAFPDLLPLLECNGRPVRPDPDFDHDLEAIIAHLQQLDADEAIGATLADKYTLTAEIGHGGMGVVYRAEQKQPVRRTVAVKLIKPGMDSRDVLARFDAERQALAVMDAKLTDQQRGDLRKQALQWLRADLAAWGKLLDENAKEARPAVQRMMTHWKQDTDLAGVRDPGALKKLAQDERDAWQKLWKDVDALLARSLQKK